MTKTIRICLILASLLIVLPRPAPAADVRMDLLGGLGGFEYAGDTQWNVYAHPDYDFDARSGWVSDYRSTAMFRASVLRRISGSGSGDTVTVRCVRSSDGYVSQRIYEFTNGGGARTGNVEVNLGTDPSPSNAASKLRSVMSVQQGAGATACVSASVDQATVYIKPLLGWEFTILSDSDSSDARIVTALQTWRFGFDPAEPDDSVAVGWFRKSGGYVDPGSHIVYRIVPGEGIGGSACQYFGLRNHPGPVGSVFLSTLFFVKDRPSNVRPGDTVTFRVDHVRMTGYDGLPVGASVTYRIGLDLAGTVYEQVLPKSSAAGSAEISQVVPAGVGQFVAYLRVDGVGNLTGRDAAIYVDGAHLYVKRAGQSDYATWQVPAARGRSIKTMKLHAVPDSTHDIYELARDYDKVTIGESQARWIPLLKYLNPSIRVYLYRAASCTDARDSRGVDLWYCNSPLQMGYVLSGRTAWLYSDNAGGYASRPEYPTQFYLRLTDVGLQGVWAERVRDAALRWRFDGIWIDDAEEVPALWNGTKLVRPQRDPWEVQRFIHAVAPVLRSAGLEVIVNSATRHFETGAGQVYHNPFWTPTVPYNTSEYAANSPNALGDGYQNEYAFWSMRNVGGVYVDNRYDKDYWLACLADMDAAKRWNTATSGQMLGAGQKRWVHQLILGIDKSYDPAQGVDGWLQFGLASYLLGASEWTSFAWQLYLGGTASLDTSITQRLGSPISDHAAYGGDPCCRHRLFGATADGGLGGVVVVNANPDVSRTYSVPFEATDEAGNPIGSGSVITLKPHTGRILLRKPAAIRVTISVPTQSVAPGDAVTATVSYTNDGSAPVENVVLRARVPLGMSYVAGSAESSGGTFNSASNTVSWSVGTVSAGQGGQKTFGLRVN